MKRQIIAGVLSAGMLFTTVGCGNRSDTGENTVGGAVAVQTEETSAAAETQWELSTTTEPEITTETPATSAVTQTETTTAETTETNTLTDASGSFTYTGELQWIGDAEHGYLQVPADYMVFQDVEVTGLVQYCKNPYTIVTLQHYTGITAEDAAQNTYANMQQEEACEGLEGAEVTISDYTAKQVYAYYADTNQYLVCWLIPDPEDAQACYFLSIEFLEEDKEIMACSSTFTPYQPE